MFLFHQWKSLTVFQKVFLSMMSFMLILLKRFFFLRLIELMQKLHCLLRVFLSISHFMFKNVFLERDLFMISLFIILFMKDVWFSRTCCYFMGACLWIASPIASWTIKLKLLFSEVIRIILFLRSNISA